MVFAARRVVHAFTETQPSPYRLTKFSYQVRIRPTAKEDHEKRVEHTQCHTGWSKNSKPLLS